ncbi:MAG TPA: ArsA family ATPase [Thermoanaerobaculia bacterium]|jgi:TRC40/GET3/ArsA family transport-energizing ATPase|nr:ArsA family ATPase [Thermoanaerobaculia bacterium]
MKFRIFGGKGGVGKTTCAAAVALAAAEGGSAGSRVLVVSTDPAHSLGDAFAKHLAPGLTAPEPTRIPNRRGELWAAELAAGPAIARWTAEHREAVRTLAERGTYLDGEDVDRFLDLTLPGGDELIAWLEIDRLVRESGCEEVVVDTAPTAHTLRLLASPDTLRRFATLLDRLDGRHREMAEHFGTWRPDAVNALIADLEAEGRALEERLRDPKTTVLTWVLLPEALAIAETKDALAALEDAGIPVRDLIVNRVLADAGDDCPLCQERRRAEAQAIREIRKAFGDREIRFLPEAEKEPRGKAALRLLQGANLANRDKNHPPTVETPRGVPRGASPGRGHHTNHRNDLDPIESSGSRLSGFISSRPGHTAPGGSGSFGAQSFAGDAPRGTPWGVSTVGVGRYRRWSRPRHGLAWLDDIAPPGLRLLFFGGKGGVGKTTCSAAVALALARRRKGTRILLLSTDPAHSLADVLKIPLGSDERSLQANLVLRELDARGEFARWRERHGGEVDRAVGAFATEGSGVGDLLDFSPPGLDELIAVSSLLDAEAAYNLVIVDTAPTGHALRLLEMPELALSWDRFLLSLLLKYREAVGLGDLAAGLVDLSRSLKRLQALLRDPDQTRFVVVTRAAELPRRETERLLGSLKRLGIAVPAVVVNAAAPPGAPGCPRCGGPAPRPIKTPYAMIEAPATFPPPRGARALAAWVQDWTWTAGIA